MDRDRLLGRGGRAGGVVPRTDVVEAAEFGDGEGVPSCPESPSGLAEVLVDASKLVCTTAADANVSAEVVDELDMSPDGV